MTTSSSDDHLDEIAARAAFVALHSSAGRNLTGKAEYCWFLPHPVPILATEAIERLAELPKPVLCIAFIKLHLLAIGVWSRCMDAHSMELHVSGARWRLDAIQRTYRISTQRRVAIRGEEGEDVLLNPEALERFFLDYSLFLAESRVDWADDEAQQNGVVATVQFSPPSGGGYLFGRSL
jgi:hypothetical protein